MRKDHSIGKQEKEGHKEVQRLNKGHEWHYH